MKIHTCHK